MLQVGTLSQLLLCKSQVVVQWWLYLSLCFSGELSSFTLPTMHAYLLLLRAGGAQLEMEELLKQGSLSFLASMEGMSTLSLLLRI